MLKITIKPSLVYFSSGLISLSFIEVSKALLQINSNFNKWLFYSKKINQLQNWFWFKLFFITLLASTLNFCLKSRSNIFFCNILKFLSMVSVFLSSLHAFKIKVHLKNISFKRFNTLRGYSKHRTNSLRNIYSEHKTDTNNYYIW